ncbi:MAG: hypothetical protein WC852_04075 [Candidatus Nanoarchaeia archaeon]|jgi:hypothetical protein
MTLEEELKDPEPVCVEGIDPELAVQRAYDAGLMAKSDCGAYKKMKLITPAYFALGGFFLSCFTPFTILMAAMFLGLGTLAELKGARGYENFAGYELEKRLKH